MNTSKILIVDDEPLNLLLYSEILKSTGYIVVTGEDGFDAIRLAEEEKPDLIILDWNMPRLDGFEALKELKKKESTFNIPVIMITGIMTTSGSLQSAMNEGASDFLRKPFDKIELNARIRSLLLLSNSMKEIKEKYQIIENKNQFIQSLIESVPHPMVFYSLDGIIVGYNHKFEQLLELNGEDIKGTLIYRFLKDSDMSLHLNSDMELTKVSKDIVYESRFGNNNFDFIISKTNYHDLSGKIKGILCVMTDITELRKVHGELMESKKRELASSALRLIQISEMNNNLINELGSLNEHTSKKGNEIIRNIISQFSINSGEHVWKEFETRFENVYESFYNGLNARFPELTPGERKLCALLRLNLSSKDIAAITFQNSQSIDMARYRLRKKLNLSQDENLIDFLMSI